MVDEAESQALEEIELYEPLPGDLVKACVIRKVVIGLVTSRRCPGSTLYGVLYTDDFNDGSPEHPCIDVYMFHSDNLELIARRR